MVYVYLKFKFYVEVMKKTSSHCNYILEMMKNLDIAVVGFAAAAVVVGLTGYLTVRLIVVVFNDSTKTNSICGVDELIPRQDVNQRLG